MKKILLEVENPAGRSTDHLPEVSLAVNSIVNEDLEKKVDNFFEDQHENEKNSENLKSEINIHATKETNTENKLKKEKKMNKKEEIQCETCTFNEKAKMINCYLCKKSKCKNCAEKEHHYSSKKRDQSSYICPPCFGKDESKIRKKNSELPLNEMNYLNYANNLISNNFFAHSESTRVFKGKKRLRDQEIEKKVEEAGEDTLNLDFLHECVTPPSELNRENENSPNKIIRRISKRHKPKNLNNLHLEKTCHLCKKASAKFEYFKCLKSDCGMFFCSRCIKKFPKQDKFDVCFVCRKICKCSDCQSKNNRNSNFIQIDLDNLDSKKNLVKIDEFVILENEDDEMDYEEPEEQKTQNIQDIPCINIIDEDLRQTVENVENSKYQPKTNKVLKCIVCSSDKNTNFLHFRSLKEFIKYLTHYFNKNVDNTAYNDAAKDYKEYASNHFQVYYKNADFNFKSVKQICKDCFSDTLKSRNGFNNLFSTLHIGQNLMIADKKKEVTTGNIVNKPAANPHRQNTTNSSNNISTPIINIKVPNTSQSAQGNNNNPQFNKMIEILGNLKQNNANSSNLIKSLLTNETGEKEIDKIQENKESLLSLLNGLNTDGLNVTNIIMNIDPNKNTQSNCVIDELKKQFFCIQYYSLLQKLFISYIFKNLELFIEQISKNQSLGEFVVNNMMNCLPKTQDNQGDLQSFTNNVNEQMNLLKSINSYGVQLTSALSSNFEDLKNNGIKIFKAMDPSLQQSVMNNLHLLMNTNEGSQASNLGKEFELLKNNVNDNIEKEKKKEEKKEETGNESNNTNKEQNFGESLGGNINMNDPMSILSQMNPMNKFMGKNGMNIPPMPNLPPFSGMNGLPNFGNLGSMIPNFNMPNFPNISLPNLSNMSNLNNLSNLSNNINSNMNNLVNNNMNNITNTNNMNSNNMNNMNNVSNMNNLNNNLKNQTNNQTQSNNMQNMLNNPLFGKMPFPPLNLPFAPKNMPPFNQLTFNEFMTSTAMAGSMPNMFNNILGNMNKNMMNGPMNNIFPFPIGGIINPMMASMTPMNQINAMNFQNLQNINTNLINQNRSMFDGKNENHSETNENQNIPSQTNINYDNTKSNIENQ